METLAEALIALTALTAMEIVLGIDNIVFIAILVGRLPENQRAKARTLGLGGALVSRIILLLTLKWILGLTEPIFTLPNIEIFESWMTEEIHEVSWRDIILLCGGLFLVGKSVHEIHDKFEGHAAENGTRRTPSFTGILLQITILDIIFSLDSVITAVGMANQLWVMVLAIILAIGVMLVFAGSISKFVEEHQTLKMLALSFLILIGVMLIAEGIGSPIHKGYIYFAMSFALVVEVLNLKIRTRVKPKVTA